MADILLKTETGKQKEYYGIETITVQRVGGGTAAYSFGYPAPTEHWEQMTEFLSQNTYTKYTANVQFGKLVSSDIADFGLWYLNNYDAIKLLEKTSWSNFQPVSGGALLSNNYSANKGLYLFDSKEMTARQVYPYGYSWSVFQKIGGGYLVSGAGTGLLYYDETSKTAIQIYAKGTYWS